MDDDHDRVRTYASAVVSGCSAERITAVTRFAAGERHAVYKLSYVDPAGTPEHVVVRVALGDDPADRARTVREAGVLAEVQGFAAPVLHDVRFDNPWFDTTVMCMEFVAGEQRNLQKAPAREMAFLGSVVAWVHRRPTDRLLASFPESEGVTLDAYRDARLHDLADRMPAARDPLPGAMQRRLRRAHRHVDAMPRLDADGDGLVLLHGDVATDNVIWSRRPVLIDWEYARLGDPADEIAYTFSQHGLTRRQRDAFWRGYGSDRLVDRVRWWEPVTLLGSALWWVEQWLRRSDADAAGRVDASAPKPLDYYLHHVTRRLERLELLVGAV